MEFIHLVYGGKGPSPGCSSRVSSLSIAKKGDAI